MSSSILTIAGGALTRLAIVIAVLVIGCGNTASPDPSSGLPSQNDVLEECGPTILKRLRVELLQEAFRAGDSSAFREMLNVSGLDDTQQKTFLQLYVNNSGSLEDFWAALEADSSFKEDDLYEVRLTLFLARLAEYRLSVLQQIARLRQAENLTTLRDISMISRDKWRQVLADSHTDLEPDSFIRSVDKTFDDLRAGGCK